MAILGFVLTAVLVPFLGLIGMILFDGNYRSYFDKLGRIPALLLIAIILMLIGPFGVVPRCITVAFGGFNLLMPSLSFELFSLFFCGIIIACIWTKSRIVDIIGLFLTPFKLGGIIILILFGLWFGQDAVQGGLSSPEAFTNALFKGYQTMDLMAAFFFSSAIVYYLRNHLTAQDDNKTLVKMSVAASIMGALLLTIVYIGFIGLGAKYAPYLHDAQPEHLLVAIGASGTWIFCKARYRGYFSRWVFGNSRYFVDIVCGFSAARSNKWTSEAPAGNLYHNGDYLCGFFAWIFEAYGCFGHDLGCGLSSIDCSCDHEHCDQANTPASNPMSLHPMGVLGCARYLYWL